MCNMLDIVIVVIFVGGLWRTYYEKEKKLHMISVIYSFGRERRPEFYYNIEEVTFTYISLYLLFLLRSRVSRYYNQPFDIVLWYLE